jgi:proteic killer suppression protein
MDIAFATTKLQKIFNTEKELVRTFGAEIARIVMRRMAILRAAANLDEVSHLPPPRRHELTGDRKGQFALDLKPPYRLLLQPNCDPLPYKDDGGIDLKRVTAITIIAVEDYH